MFTPYTFNDKLIIDIGAGRVLSIKEIPAYHQLRLIHTVGAYFGQIKKMAEGTPGNYTVYYLACVNAVWELVKQSATKRKGLFGWWEFRKVKKIFFNKANDDVVFFFDLINEIYNFWLFMGKWVALLAEGVSLQMTMGKKYTAYFMTKDYENQTSKNYLLEKLIRG